MNVSMVKIICKPDEMQLFFCYKLNREEQIDMQRFIEFICKACAVVIFWNLFSSHFSGS